MSRKFARAPRRAVHALPSERHALIVRLHHDQRYLGLKPRARTVLDVAIERYCDGTGHFWPKVRTLAEAAGVSTATVKRGLAEAVAVGLIEREPYLRPDGTQGSSNYFLDLRLAAPGSFVEPEPDEDKVAQVETPEIESAPEPTRWITPDPLTRWLNPEPPEQHWNRVRPLGEVGIEEKALLLVGQLSEETREQDTEALAADDDFEGVSGDPGSLRERKRREFDELRVAEAERDMARYWP